MHPHILILQESTNGLLGVNELRKNIADDCISAKLWLQVKSIADCALDIEPLTPGAELPRRSKEQCKTRNRDYSICHAVTVRLLCCALSWLITEDRRYSESAMAQMRILFDRKYWPIWCDLAHEPPVDLRTGQLAQAVGLTYDWLYNGLTAEERVEVITGLDAQAIQPYMNVISDAWWYHAKNNWLSVIVGGLGVAAMAVSSDHLLSEVIINDSVYKLKEYLKNYGSEGEFNESPMYANANAKPVEFFAAYRYYLLGDKNPLSQHPFPAMCRWVMHTTDPTGCPLAFGDTPLNIPVSVDYFPAVAAACRDSVLQGFYNKFSRTDGFRYQSNPAIQLLCYDPLLSSTPPELWDEPLARAYRAHSGIIVSRTDWSNNPGICVASKTGGTELHGHHDAGQTIIHAYGENLITDLGSLDYPADYFTDFRWEYYNASVLGHNVITINEHEPNHVDAKLVKFISKQEYSCWVMDLTSCYDELKHMYRTVIHYFPNAVSVLDEVELFSCQNIDLRWHTLSKANIDKDGKFTINSNGIQCTSRIIRLDANRICFSNSHHEYTSPYDRNRLGELLKQKCETYVSASVSDCKCRILSLFTIDQVCGQSKT